MSSQNKYTLPKDAASELKITDTIDPVIEEQVFEHRPVRAWRYDVEQHKWRGRGKGQLSIYFNKEKNIGKMVFIDEQHNITRLLQYIDGTSHCEYSATSDNTKDEVEWHGADYTMDHDEPMIGKWKIALIDDAASTKEFKNIFNDFIDSNANHNDKESMSSINPFGFSDNKESMSSFTFSDLMNPSFDWGFDDTQHKEENDKDNGLQNMFKPIVELEEQKVDTGHENETLMNEISFSKLYVFGKDVSQQPCWKTRASQSVVCFYQSNGNGKIRIIVREHITNKLRMNQWIPNTDDAEFGLKQNKAYQWNAFDSSIAAEEENESAGFTQWCIKFESAQNAESFAAQFERAMKVNESITKNDGLLQSPQRSEHQIIEKEQKQKKEEEMKYAQLMKQHKLLKNDKDKLQDDYNVMTAQFNSLQMELNTLKSNNQRLKHALLAQDKSLKIAEASHNILKTKCDSLDTVNKRYQIKMNQQIDAIKKLEQMNMVLQQERNDEMNKLKIMKNKDDEKKEDNVDVEQKCKVSFKRWLHHINLSRYLQLFEKNESDDIRYIEFFDQDTIKNDIGIKHVVHCKYIMKKINEFKKEETAFNSILDRNKEITSFKTQFEVNGILTMQQLKNEIKTKKDLAKILQLKPNDDKVDVVWKALFAKQIEVPPMIAPKNNEGNITAYI